MRPKKSLGQNFLMHARIAERIADAAVVGVEDTVLEIGPGTGMLTRALLAKGAKVIAVEADDELIPVLSDTFPSEIASKKLVLIHEDIRAFMPTAHGLNSGEYKVVANIPYYITGEIIRQFLSNTTRPSSITLLVQKEVATRVARAKKESLLSLSVKVYGTPKYEFTVPRGAFRPAPNVDSAVLSVRNITNPFKITREEARFFEILHAGFSQKRKFLARNLESIAAPEVIATAFSEAGLKNTVRSEDVSLSAWKVLAAHI